ncbi:Serum response factor -like protein [Toxocara canis]|uniref:Serum response factor homolog n=1 Tax=Toxocara canis TaxID=6265 RepID=A0A0B2UNF2_TOXCA|nr:Serum response factor -like protein [Toxocara canis]
MSMVPGETCFNLNFSNPGSNSPIQSLLLAPKETSSNEGGMDGDCDESSPRPQVQHHQIHDATPTLPNGKKTKGRVKIKMEYIGNKLRRYTTFSKRKTGIMKKAYELSTLTGTQVMLLVASETGHVYTFATKKLQPMISSEAGKTLIQNCLNTPDIEETVDPLGTRNEFTFEPQQSNLRKRKLNESSNEGGMDGDCDESSPRPQVQHHQIHDATPTLPNGKKTKDGFYLNGTGDVLWVWEGERGHTIARHLKDGKHQQLVSTSLKCGELPTMVHPSLVGTNNEEAENSEGESESVDSPEVVEDSESDDKQKEKEAARSLSLQQTLKEALRVAAAQRQMQKNKAAKNNVQTMASNLSLLTPFLLPGLNAASTSTSNNTVMYQVPQGVVYTNGEGSDSTGLFANNSDNQHANQQLLFPLNSLTLQQNLLQMMSTAALSAQLDSGEQSS